MLYRKSPPTPPRLLLRIAATAGVGTLVGMAACSSASEGIVVYAPSDASDDAQVIPSDAFESEPLGILFDASDVDSGHAEVHGVVPLPDDAGKRDADAGLPDGAPADATDDGPHTCHPCGVIIQIDP